MHADDDLVKPEFRQYVKTGMTTLQVCIYRPLSPCTRLLVLGLFCCVLGLFHPVLESFALYQVSFAVYQASFAVYQASFTLY